MCPAAAGAFLFLLHPLNSEAVLCAGFRPDLVSATLILAATLLLLPAPPAGGGIGRPTALRLAAAAAVTAAALLFKEIAAAAVVLLPLLLLLKPDGGGWKTRGRTALVLAAVLAGVFAIFLAAWFRFRAPVNPSQFLGGGGRALGVANGITALWEIYAHRLAWPWPLRVAHPFEPVASLAAARFLWAAAATAGLLAAAAFLFRRNRTALFGLAWTAVCFLPYLQLVPIPDPVAERFAYVPMAGVAMLVAALAWQFRPLAETRPPLRRVCLAVGIGLALLYAGMDLRRSLDWRTDIGLNIANWEEAGDTSPAALENLGALYQMKAHGLRAEQRPAAVRECLDKAGEALARLRAMRPQNVAGWRLSAAWAAATGRPEEARAFIREALRLSPGDAEAREMAGKLGVPETGNG